MDLVSTKILVAVLFAVLRFLFGALPVKLYRLLQRWEGQDEDSHHFINPHRHQQVTCALALCQSFGGGVLFATCFLHMMPEVYQSMEVLKDFGNLNTDYPLSQLTISMGFFLVYFVEEFSHWFVTKVPDDAVQCYRNKNRNPTPTNKVSPAKEKEKESEKDSAFIIEDEMYKELENSSVNTEVLKENEKNMAKSLELDEELEQQAEQVEEQVEKQAKTKQQMVRYLLVVLALSLHSIFEGLAIGIQNSAANIWYLFVAVSIHSATILFYISLELILAKTKTKRIMTNITILSLTSSLGVIMGMLLTMNSDMNTKAKSTAVVVLEGISAGTLLYITFFEVLNREKERRVYTFWRGLFIIGGFGLMALLQCYEMSIE